MKYICELCGYEYDPAAGDPENGVAEKTEFEDIPANWVCPLCGASTQDFEAQSEDDGEPEDDEE